MINQNTFHFKTLVILKHHQKKMIYHQLIYQLDRIQFHYLLVVDDTLRLIKPLTFMIVQFRVLPGNNNINKSNLNDIESEYGSLTDNIFVDDNNGFYNAATDSEWTPSSH